MNDPTEVPGWARLTQLARSRGAVYETCERFLSAVECMDASAAWGMLDGAYRVFWVQGLVSGSPAGLGRRSERDRLVASVVQTAPMNPLWPDLRQTLEQWFEQSFGWFRGRELGCSIPPTPLAPDVEVVDVGPLDPPGAHGGVRRPATTVAVVMRLMPDRSWLVAGVDYLPVPGWPPRVAAVPG